MKTSTAEKREAHLVTVSAVEPGDSFYDYMQDIHNRIAQRAYEIFESRGREHGHDVDDWLHSENEILQPVPITLSHSEHLLEVHAIITGFGAEELDVRVEPFRVFITGRKKDDDLRPIFSSIDLPNEIETKTALAALENSTLTISLRKSVGNVIQMRAPRSASSGKRPQSLQARSAQFRKRADIAKRYSSAAKDHAQRASKHLNKARALATKKSENLPAQSNLTHTGSLWDNPDSI